MLRVNDQISIEDWEITEQFIRSGGPGGQNVNKVNTAVELRFEAERSPNFPQLGADPTRFTAISIRFTAASLSSAQHAILIARAGACRPERRSRT